ncbi:MAG TPA: zf-HC2 domain-containing protein, partial [Longimicrobium sp.]|nr:zf-HC2 domain-containing protein [Longimicrobium sp.]
MTHEQAIERLDDYASGELPDIERRLMERHLAGCGECRAEAEAIRALLAEVAALPAAVAPPADLWQGIAGRLEPRAAGATVDAEETNVISLDSRRKVWQPPRWALQAAAAVVLMVGSSLVTAKYLGRQPAGPLATLPPATVRTPARGTAPAAGGQMTALAAFHPAEREYQQAVDDLARVLETRRASLAPETVATLEHNLAIIDAAIAESRAAL